MTVKVTDAFAGSTRYSPSLLVSILLVLKKEIVFVKSSLEDDTYVAV